MELTGCQIKLDWNDSSKGFKTRKNTKSSLFLDFWKGSQRLGSDVRVRAIWPVSTRPRRPCSLLLQIKVLFQRGNGMIGMVPNKPLPTPPPMSMKPSDNTPSFRDLGKHMLLARDEGIQSLRNKRHDSLSQHQNKNLLGGIPDPPKLANPKIIVGQSRRVGKVTLPF